MTRGLVLGKFAPLHKGHQRLIDVALGQVERLYVLVYDAPSVTRVPLGVRAGWVRSLHPGVEVIEGHGSPEAAGRNLEIMRLQEEYIVSVVPSPVTHFFSGEWYGAHVSRALGAVDVRVDEGRSRHPISGSAVRSDAFLHRQHLDPLVYRNLIRRVVLLGAESTGKSTLAEALAARFSTCAVPEYGRQFWTDHRDARGQLSPAQLVTLARTHHEATDAQTLNARRVLFMDTDARTTAQYARWYHGDVPAALEVLVSEATASAALTVLCGDDIPYVDDGTRSGEERRRQAQDEIRRELRGSGAAWIEARGSVEQRVEEVVRAIEELKVLPWF